MNSTRRFFLQTAGAIGAALSTAGRSLAHPRTLRRRTHPDLGPLVPDAAGILDLPDGFTYQVLSRTGEEMDDGLLVPAQPDGMAAFPGADGKTRLVRNHELMPGWGSPWGADGARLERIDEALVYDLGHGVPCAGGTTTLVYDTTTGQLEKQFLSLAGTLRNCAGGRTPWGSWVTCEEAPNLADATFAMDHGFAFEVPADADGPVEPIPLYDMGRFNHEAIAVDERSGAVYQTEDRPDGLLYRYLPDTKGDLAGGGRLQALAIVDAPSLDLRNWTDFTTFPSGHPIPVEWLELEDVVPAADDLRTRGFAAGAARFARGEGMWAGDDCIWFACTSGGPMRCGQIFRYTPSAKEGTAGERGARGTLELFLQSPDPSAIDFCDNLTVTPWGDLLLCEDGAGDNFLVGVTAKGEIYPFGRNAGDPSEFAGATFSPDGSTLFVNVQVRGLTLAIRGPWPR